MVRNPNPYATDIIESTVEPQKDWSSPYHAMGVQGTNTAVLEVSSIPPLNLAERLQYLIRYPHGCVEQTTSSVFPQLYVDALMELEEAKKKRIESNIRAGIDRLSNFQNNVGGFSYWPGDSSPNYWGTNYAGHFLLEAKKKGYVVSPLILEGWIKFQQNAAKKWDVETENSYSSRNSKLMQAYRLYTLALAGQPELGAMNRLRESSQLPSTAAWRLAAAYALTGKPEVARSLIDNLDTKVKDYVELSYSYGSGLRDQAMILETLSILKDQVKAAPLAREIARKLATGYWYGTQTVAYSLLAMGKFVGEEKTDNQLKFAYFNGSGEWITAGSDRPMMQVDLAADGGEIHVRNQSGGILFTRVILRGQPLIGDPTAASNDLKMAVNYRTTNGESLDPERIEQGDGFYRRSDDHQSRKSRTVLQGNGAFASLSLWLGNS